MYIHAKYFHLHKKKNYQMFRHIYIFPESIGNCVWKECNETNSWTHIKCILFRTDFYKRGLSYHYETQYSNYYLHIEKEIIMRHIVEINASCHKWTCSNSLKIIIIFSHLNYNSFTFFCTRKLLHSLFRPLITLSVWAL